MEVTVVPSEITVRRGELAVLGVEVTDGGSAYECTWRTEWPGVPQAVTHGPEWRMSAPATFRTQTFEVTVEVKEVDSGAVASGSAKVTLNP